MKTIIAGGRDINNMNHLKEALDKSGWRMGISEVVCGKASGVDAMGEAWANQHKIHVEPFPADWDNLDAPGAIIRTGRNGKKYNAKAGNDRNVKMAEYADALLLIWNGKSKGSADMLREAKKAGLRIYQHIVPV